MMRKKLWIGSGVTVVAVMAGLLVYGSYISAQYQMEALRTAAHEQWVQLEGAIHRWSNVAPQVAAAVEPVAKQNQRALDALKSARETVLKVHDPQAVIEASRTMDESLDGVMAIGLSDQKLKNDAKFQKTEERLRQLRERVEQNRHRYNESLRNYNVFVSEFPNSVWATIAGYKQDHNFFPPLKRRGRRAAKNGGL